MTSLSRESEVRTFRAADTLDSPILKRATELAAALFRCPMSSVNLIDDDTQWLLGRTGLNLCSTAREDAFCNLTIDLPPGGVMVVENAALDPRFRDNPLVVGEPGVRFYAGALLTSSDGFNLGALCVIDTVPRSRPTEAELQQLTTIAGLVVSELERARSERRRAQQQDMLNMAEAMSGVGHWRVRRPSGEVFWSDEVYAIYGLDRAAHDPQYLNSLSFYDEPDAERLVAAITAAEAGQGPFELELGFTRADGGARRVMAKGACAFDVDGHPALLYGVFQDVTDQRRALAAAEEAAAVKSDFLANMSHELRTPLTSIIGFTDLAMARDDLAPVTRDYMRRIDNAGRSLMCLVNDILDFSKLEAGQVAIRPEPTDVERLSRDVLELFAPQVGAKDLSLDLRVAPGLLLNIDPDRVRQILLNLVSNAVKFTQVGHVTLEMVWADGRLTGSVTDTGPGMTDEQAARLFQRFSQIDGSATRKAGGTGLGLAICKGLSEAMGGGVGVESRLGVGSRFWFEIAAEAVVGTPSATPAQGAAEAAAFTLEGLDILVADDHPSNRELARLFLTGFGAEVTQAVDGQEAADLAAARRFDLILMDGRMPVMDGETALRCIRQGGLSQATPILAYTADAHPATVAEWLAKGFCGVVGKPLSGAELITAVADALKPAPHVRVRATA
ncbi:MAG: response regulator [Brevundimonas sp.]|nr:MAG: response regulator [Brevundimonas sp.]